MHIHRVHACEYNTRACVMRKGRLTAGRVAAERFSLRTVLQTHCPAKTALPNPGTCARGPSGGAIAAFGHVSAGPRSCRFRAPSSDIPEGPGTSRGRGVSRAPAGGEDATRDLSGSPGAQGQHDAVVISLVDGVRPDGASRDSLVRGLSRFPLPTVLM